MRYSCFTLGFFGVVLCFFLVPNCLLSKALANSNDNKEVKEKPSATVNRIRKDCLKVLLETMKSDNAFERSAAIRAAAESENELALPVLAKGVEDSYPTARLFAIKGYRKVAPKKALELAYKLHEDTDVWVRAEALEILGELGGKDTAPILQSSLRDPDPTVQFSASAALVRLKVGNHLPLLVNAAKSGDVSLRYQAIGYLGKVGNKPAIEILYKLLDDPEGEIIFYSLKSIGDKVSTRMIEKLVFLTAHKNPFVQREALSALGRLTSHPGMSLFAQFCDNPDPLVRLAAASALDADKESACADVFRDSLNNPDYGVRSATARILGKTNLPNRGQLLAQAIKDPNSRVRTSAVRSAGMMGGIEAWPLLLNTIYDELPVVRAYAAGNLIKLID
jgi:HEAT repeat protein